MAAVRPGRRRGRRLWRLRLIGPHGVLAEWVVIKEREFAYRASEPISFTTDRGEVFLMPGAAHSVVWEECL